jgi:hypothetical protein
MYAREKAEREAAQAKADAERKAADAERQRIQEARSAKIDAQIAELNKNLGGLNNRMGEIMETLLAPHLWEKFSEYHYGFERAYQRVGIYKKTARLTDIDILLSNGEYSMAVEVKNILNKFIEVDRHVDRIETLLQYPPAEVKGKKVLGAMACGVLDEKVRDYAFSKGFFVIELTGDTAQLVPPPEGFKPQEWT